MRFVPVKSELAQSRLAIHAVRQGWVEARTACINRLRTQAAEKLDSLPGWMKIAGFDLLDELRRIDERIAHTTPTSNSWPTPKTAASA
jgi:transposase